jgi:hypothetical protein
MAATDNECMEYARECVRLAGLTPSGYPVQSPIGRRMKTELPIQKSAVFSEGVGVWNLGGRSGLDSHA